MPSRHVESMIQRHVRVWEHHKSALEERDVRTRQGPCVTVSREYGTLGARIAKEAAARLGYEFYDQELITHIAKTENIRKALIESVDERGRDLISEWIAEQFGTEQSTSEFLSHLRRVIMTIAHHGRAVVVGRGSQFILDPRYTLRVRVFAPLEHRIASVQQRYGVDEEEARRRVTESDETRARFYRRYFGKVWDDPMHYDVLVNTACLDFSAAVELIVAGARSKLGST